MSKSDASTTNARSGLRRWFAVGFLVAFVGMALFVKQLTLFRNGVMQVPLWRFYLMELPRELGSRTLGPTSGFNGFAILGQHLAISSIAGFIAAGCGAIVRCCSVNHVSGPAREGDHSGGG